MVGLLVIVAALVATPAVVMLGVAWLVLLLVRLAPGRWGWLVATGGTAIGVGIALLAAEAQGWGWRDAWDSARGAQVQLLGGLGHLAWAVLLVNVARVINPTGVLAQATLPTVWSVWPSGEAVRTYAVATWIASTVVSLPLAWLDDVRVRLFARQEGVAVVEAEVGTVAAVGALGPAGAMTVEAPPRTGPIARPRPQREPVIVAQPVVLRDDEGHHLRLVPGIWAALRHRGRADATLAAGPALIDQGAESEPSWRRRASPASPAARGVPRDASPPPQGTIARRPGQEADDEVYDAEFRSLDPTRDRRDWDDPFSREDPYQGRDPYDQRDPFRTRHQPDRPGEGELGEGEDDDEPFSPPPHQRPGPSRSR